MELKPLKEWLLKRLEVLNDELKKENQAPVELIDDAADQKEWLQSRLEVLNDELKKENQSPVELIDEAADQKERLQSRLEVLDDEPSPRYETDESYYTPPSQGLILQIMITNILL